MVMTSYAGTLRYLYGLQHRGMKFGLRNIKVLLAAADDPHRRFPSIHVAGTNGKGSTAAFLASVCMEAGYRTGLYTSPHLIRFTERIRVNGKEISQKRLAKYVQALKPAIESVHATFFEATTCVAFQFFADEGVEIAVVETGLGGRLDATNVLLPLASVITNVEIDHTEYLGNTVRSIAREKGGIIKKGIPCVTGSEDPLVLAVLRQIARRKKARIYQAARVATLVRSGAPGKRSVADIRTRTIRLRKIRLGFDGLYQGVNARLAVACFEILLRTEKGARVLRKVAQSNIARGLRRVARNTHLHGRFEQWSSGGRFIFDVAHNAAGMRSLVEALRVRRTPGVVAVFGVMKDKQYASMLKELGRAARVLVPVAPAMARALNPGALYKTCRRIGLPVVPGGSIRVGIGRARKLAGASGHVLVTGSHYVVGEAMQMLMKEKA